MATYIQNKAGAFQKRDDVNAPLAKRSESRLKKYSSTTDTRVWVNNAVENKAFMIQLMGQDKPRSIKNRKSMGQIIPIDMIWKILLNNKNKYINDLEDRIKNFVDLLLELKLSSIQITNLKHLCNTSFRSINEYLLKCHETELTCDVVCDIEQCIQATPGTISSVTETQIETSSVGIKTPETVVRTSFTNTDARLCVNRSSATIPRRVSDVCLQVKLAPQPKADKSVSVRIRTSTEKMKSVKSLHDKTTDMSVTRLKSSGLRRSSEKHVVSKSQSAVVCTKDKSVGDISSKARKSCVSFALASLPPNEGIPIPSRVRLESKDSLKNIDLLDAIQCNKSSNTTISFMSRGDVVEVVSESAQTRGSIPLLSPSIIQIYRSTKKSSMESTLYKHTSDQPFGPKYLEDYETDHSTEDVAVTGPDFSDNDSEPNDKDEKSRCVKKNKSSSCTCQSCPRKDSLNGRPQPPQPPQAPAGANNGDESDEDHFEDCSPVPNEKGMKDEETNVVSCIKKKYHPSRSTSPMAVPSVKKKDKETHVVSCIERKKAACNTSFHDLNNERLKAAQAEILKHKVLAETALRHLEIIRQTLYDNGVTISNIDTNKISANLLSSNNIKELVTFEGCLFQACGFQIQPTTILFEQWKLIEQMCKAITIPNKVIDVSISKYKPIISECLDISLDKSNLQKEIDSCKSKLDKVEQLNIERLNLQASVYKLENELKTYESIKYCLVSDPEVAEVLEANDVLKEIQELKRKAELGDQLEQDLACEKCYVNTLKDNLSNMSSNRFNEFEKLRYKAQEADILRLELDRLKVQLTNVHKLQADNINLYNKCSDLEKQSKQSTPSNDVDTVSLKEQNAEIEKLRKEKQSLLCTVVAKECELVGQEEHINRLVMHIDRLTTNSEDQQERSKQIVAQLRSDIEMKDSYISKLDNNLGNVEEKLKKSITSISKDSTSLQCKLIQLQQTCDHYKSQNDSMQDTITALRKELEMQEELNKTYSLELQRKSKSQGQKVEDSCGESYNQKLKSVNRMENILKKSHNAVRKVVEELAKQYRCDIKGIQDVVPEIINNS